MSEKDESLPVEDGSFRAALARLPGVLKRLADGQQFNLYEVDDGYAVCLGPITHRPLSLATTGREDIGELIVGALRIACGATPPPTSEGGA